MNKLLSIALAFIVGSVTGQVENPVEADVTPMEYMDGNQTLLGHLSLPDTTKPAPAVIIIP